ncbi:MAG: ABC transporter permease [Campylobacterota bacterium]|nr:ABC transporter permease [Campylobacterota bacterium]
MKHNILLAFTFAKRDFKERYVGMGLGQFWFILHPIIMITIYTILFAGLMQLKHDVTNNAYAYSVYIVPGIIAWTAFSTIVNRQHSIFTARAGLIKKINVPAYTYQLSIIITEFAIFLLSMVLGILFLIIVDYPLSWNFLWLLPIMVLQVMFAFGFGVILSLFSPFIKDLKVVVPIVLQLWFWLTPIIYMKEITGTKYPWILTYNPFYQYVHLYQDIFVYSKAPTIQSLVTITIISVVTLTVAGYLYKKMVGTIKDII